MNLTKIIVRRPMAALMIILAIVVFGFMSLTNMEQESMPDTDTPMMIIMTTYSGADPENVDKLVTSPIESAVGTLSGLTSISSVSNEGSSMVMLEYEYDTNMDTAYIDLKESMDRIVQTLPDDVSSPMVLEMSMNSSASVSLSIQSESRDDLLQYVEDEISPEFEKLSTVAEVSVRGGQTDYISVELIEEKMQQYGLNMSAIANAVATADFSQPSGEMDHGSQTLSLTSSVSYKSVSDLEDLPISLGGGKSIRLADVARVYDAKKDAESASRFNGRDTISISLTKRQSASAVSLSEQAMQVVDSLNASGDVTIEVMSDESETIQESIVSVAQTLVLGIIISMIILFLFFGNVRASLIVGSSMPVSLLVAFICMNAMGFTLNVITMSSLVLGVGMMVDNSIVVIDSCFKNTKNRTFAEAAVEGTKFVLLSIVASTITTIVVFLPLASIGGMVGQMFKPLGYTVAFSLLASLFSAMTLVPLFFAQFKPVEKKTAPAAKLLKWLERGYVKLLKKILNKKKTAFAISLALVVAALFMASNLNMELMSSTDEGTISISIDTRPGMQLEKADAIVNQIEEMVAAHEDVEKYTSSAGGGGGMMGSSSNSVTAYLQDNRKMETAEVVDQWRLETAEIPDCDITVSSQSSMMGSLSSDDVEINLKGSDLDTLRDFSQEVADVFRAHSSIITVTTSLDDGNPQAEIIVDSTKASAYDLTPQEVSSSVSRALSGINASSIARDGRDYTVTVEYPKDKYTNMNDVNNMIITSNTGKSVALSDVAAIKYSNAASSIRKDEGQYNITVSGTPISSQKFQAESDINAQVRAMQFPESVSQSNSSMMQMMNESFASIGQAILIAVLLVFMVMTIQFESIKHSLMVMVCIPFSLIGSIALLAITGSTLNMTSLLGFLVLVGTVVNNGILFVDTTNEYRKDLDVRTALVRTGRHRLRPILMTTLTTVLSMIPMAIGLGTGSEMMQGMGLVVIGGLTASTILTLLLLPTFYLIIDGNPEKRKHKKEARQVKREEKVRKIQQKNLEVEANELPEESDEKK